MPTFAPETDPYLNHDPHITEHEEAAVDAVERAEAAAIEYRAAKEDIERVLTTSLQKVFKVGDVIYIGRLFSERKMNPCFLRAVAVTLGNSRNTPHFRIASMPVVTVNMGYLDMTKWRCEAVPISEKTGKDMSGNTHGCRGKNTVILEGDMFPYIDNRVTGPELKGVINTYVLQFVSWCENPADEIPSKNFVQLPNRTTS